MGAAERHLSERHDGGRKTAQLRRYVVHASPRGTQDNQAAVSERVDSEHEGARDAAWNETSSY